MTTLVVGPMGDRPWIPIDELVEQLAAGGRDPILNAEVDGVIPSLEPLAPRLGTWVNSLPCVSVWMTRMLVRWRRAARQRLRAADVESILVWDEVMALLCCLARPRGVEVVWVPGPPEGTRLYERVRRATVRRWVDRVATEWDGP